MDDEQRRTVPTPLGPVELTWSVDGADDLEHVEKQRLPGAFLDRWVRPGELEVQLVVAHIDPPLTDYWLPLDGYVGAVWSFTAFRAAGPFTIDGSCTAPDAAAMGGSDCGQKLTAVTLDHDGFTLSIGTHDVEALAGRILDPRHAWGPALTAGAVRSRA